MVGIIDYGAGNLKNVAKAVDFLGARYIVSDSAGAFAGCDRLILPGVGAFPSAMKMLRGKGLVEFIKDYARQKPLLGICLGMQMLFEKSYEIEECEGLGLVAGEVVRIPDKGLKIPHMGWNELCLATPCALTAGIKNGDYVYFVHSFMAQVKNSADLAACADYGVSVTAAVSSGNVCGTQFHPEKSGDVGMRILKNFLEL